MTRSEIIDMGGIQATTAPFHKFMVMNTRPANLTTLLDLGQMAPPAHLKAMP